MARTLPASARLEALLVAQNAKLDTLISVLTAQLAPAPSAKPKAKAKVAEPKAQVRKFHRVPCARDIPCQRTFLPNGSGADNHRCAGF